MDIFICFRLFLWRFTEDAEAGLGLLDDLTGLALGGIFSLGLLGDFVQLRSEFVDVDQIIWINLLQSFTDIFFFDTSIVDYLC